MVCDVDLLPLEQTIFISCDCFCQLVEEHVDAFLGTTARYLPERKLCMAPSCRTAYRT